MFRCNVLCKAQVLLSEVRCGSIRAVIEQWCDFSGCPHLHMWSCCSESKGEQRPEHKAGRAHHSSPDCQISQGQTGKEGCESGPGSGYGSMGQMARHRQGYNVSSGHHQASAPKQHPREGGGDLPQASVFVSITASWGFSCIRAGLECRQLDWEGCSSLHQALTTPITLLLNGNIRKAQIFGSLGFTRLLQHVTVFFA